VSIIKHKFSLSSGCQPLSGRRIKWITAKIISPKLKETAIDKIAQVASFYSCVEVLDLGFPSLYVARITGFALIVYDFHPILMRPRNRMVVGMKGG